MHSKSTKYTVILLLVSLVMLTANLGILPVNIMEARNLITAREMVQDGNWILTTLNGFPRYEKPPLPTWITAVLGAIFGFNSLFVLRLAVVAVTLLLIVYAYKLSVKIGLSEKQGFHNGLILATSFYIYFSGRDNQWDIYCHSFMFVSIFFLWKILKKSKKPFIDAVLGGIFLACSILSKGPVSPYGLLLPFLIAYGWIYKFKFENKTAIVLIIYALIGIILGASWSIYAHWADPKAFAKMAQTETERWSSDYNSEPFYYYWSFFTQSGIWTITSLLALIYPYLKNKVSDVKAYKFTLIWTLASLILLSLIPEKKVRYLLPVLIPLALNTGFYVDFLWKNAGNLTLKADKFLMIFSFGLVGVIGIAYPFVLFSVFHHVVEKQMIWSAVSSFVLFFTGIFILYFLAKKDFPKVFYGLIALQCAVMVACFPLVKSFLHNPNARSAKTLQEITHRKIPVFDYEYGSPEIIWDYGDKTRSADMKIIEKELVTKDTVGVLVMKNLESDFFKKINPNLSIQKVSYIDINTSAPSSKGYKPRLYRDFYFVIKK